ncbi:albicidin efflux pump [Leifsonia xyli subsp. cynodontis DSM 46306]|uniref:Major facilitator superfamily (MFS) profile domain-containing protein n=1 Tax=Leifsonia xyli subsp. cynodontis DSM 46306 TaxID=1389489 RepID=U3PED2_LEIXC|nr:DHA2 family efflux MFS transporter permease subunit [Leifsonia xyli]AGW41923.1 albicidin efflux pump [Leifsonia xyli subsp. cynodontis DSM 46306]
MTEKTSPLTSPPTGPPATAPAAPAELSKRDSRVIWLLLAATFVVILNETIMTVALPKLMDDLRVDALAAQWLSTAFMLTMAVVIPITGFLLQRLSTRAVFIAALSLFSLGTLTAALAPGFAVLVGARVIQATGTAIMLPLLMTTLMTVVPPAKRGRTMGNVSIVISVAPAIGPAISGFILNYLAWRWIFLIVLPIALVMLLIGVKYVENVGETSRRRIDVLSVALSAFGFGGLVYGLTLSGESSGAGAGPVLWVSLAVGVVGLTAFVLRQLVLQRTDRALLDLRTFRSPLFTTAIAMMAVSMASLFGVIIVLPLYLQHVLRLDTLSTGLLLLPGGLVMGLAAPVVGRLYDRFGPQPLVAPGAILVRLVLWGLTMVTEHTPVSLLLIAHIAFKPRARADVHAAFHSGAGRGSAAPLLARLGDRRHRAAGRGRGGDSAADRLDVAADLESAPRRIAGRCGDRGRRARGLPRGGGHLAVRGGRVVLRAQARGRARRSGRALTRHRANPSDPGRRRPGAPEHCPRDIVAT